MTEIKLDIRNSLFPSELKLLRNTIAAIHNSYAVALRIPGNTQRERIARLKTRLESIRGKEWNYDNASFIYNIVANQEQFLDSYEPSSISHAPGSFEFVAKRLRVILPKMQRRLKELHRIEHPEYYCDSEQDDHECQGCKYNNKCEQAWNKYGVCMQDE